MSDIDIEDKNIVLVVADTVSAFHLPPYGYERETAPFLTELAENNTVFENAYSNAPWTVPSHASMFSGELPAEHGSTTKEPYFSSESFVEDLREKEYTTVGISSNDAVSKDLNFDKGFETFQEVFDYEVQNSEDFINGVKRVLKKRNLNTLKIGLRFLYRKISGSESRGAENIDEGVRQKIKGENSPNFLFINYTEAHLPYNAPKEYVKKFTEDPEEKISQHMSDYYDADNPERFYKGYANSSDQELIDLYDASIRYLDDKIKSLYQYLDEELEDMVFIVTSDHGENFGEHGAYFHQCGIWEKSLKIPLIIAGEGVENQRITENFSWRNLRPLILEGKIKTTETVYAQYNRWNNLIDFDEESSKQEQSEKARKYGENRSKAVIKNNQGYVRNSELQDFQFITDQKCYSENNECFENTEKLKSKIEMILGD